MPLVFSQSKFVKNRMGDDAMWRHLIFLKIIVNISNSTGPMEFILGTNIQHHVTTKSLSASGLKICWRSRVKVKSHKNERMVISRKVLHPHTSYQGTIQWTTSLLSLHIDVRSRSHLKVKGHRHGDVCVLWNLLVTIIFTEVSGWWLLTVRSDKRVHAVECV